MNTGPRPPFYQRAVPMLPLACCAAVFILTFLAIRLIWLIGPWPVNVPGQAGRSAVSIAFVSSLGFTGAFMALKKTGAVPIRRFLQLFFLILFVYASANIIWNFSDLIAYGDSRHFTKYLNKDIVFPRWFLGTAVLTRLYGLLWAPVSDRLPETLSSADGFVRITGAVVMFASSLLFLRARGDRLAVLLPLLSPIWIMFSTGYNEYYPFIAFVYLGLLALFLYGGLERRPPVFVAVFSSILLLSYTAYVPFGFLLIACYGLSSGWKKAAAALLMTSVICVAAIMLLWPDTPKAFLLEYRDALNLGEKNTHYPAYIGRSAGDAVPFFSLSYAFSAEHLLHLCFMFFFGAGPAPVILLAPTLSGLWRRKPIAQSAGTKAALMLGSCIVLQLCYFMLMIPKRGPVEDIDLFFTVYLTAAFIAGFSADRFLESVPADKRDIWQNCVVGSCTGSSAIILVHLLWLGIIPS